MAVRITTLSDATTGTDLRDIFQMFEDRINALEDYIEWDKELRKQNPALQDLYEKYQLTKRLSDE